MLTSDLKHAARLLSKNPGATAIMVFTLALGIGAVTAIFSVVYGVLLSPLPFPRSDRIMAVWEITRTRTRLADPNFDDFRDGNRTFQALARYRAQEVPVAGAGEPTRTGFAVVSKQFFDVLGVRPSLGRAIGDDDARSGAAPVVVASDRYWKRSLGAARDLSGCRLRAGGREYAVIGVMPPGFAFPEAADLWAPAELDPENTSRTAHNDFAIGRLRDGVTVEQAREDLSRIARGIVGSSTEQNDYLLKDAGAGPLLGSLTGFVGRPLYVLFGAVLFLLLVACANVANLLLSQAAARARELAIRSALGAGRARLMRQMLTESLLLGFLGCACGVLLAEWGVSALRSLAPASLPRLENVAISWPVLAFAAAASVVVAAGIGLVTAWRATGVRMATPLIEAVRGAAGSRSSRRLGRLLVAAQFATTLVLLVGAGLLGRSLLQILSVDPGLRTEGILTMDLSLPGSEEPAAKARLAGFYDTLLGRLGAIPGVLQTGINSVAPLDRGCPDGMFLVMSPDEMPATPEGFSKLAADQQRRGEADFCVASPGWFQALGIPLRRGRLFDVHDGFGEPHVALISETLARSRWPGEDPIGRTIEFGNMDGDLRLLTIVGVVGDTHDYGRDQPPRATVYALAQQRPRSETTVVMRTAMDPGAVISAARAIVHELAPDVPPRFRTVEEIESSWLGQRHFNLTLIAVFAAAALLLAVAGIFGVTAYSVAQRTREIGVRIALGARPGDVVGMILEQELRMTFAGVVVGIAAAPLLTRFTQTLLFGVTATDPVTFAGVALLLAAVAALACYVPARRATRVDPMVALRQD
jgi:predicted permease